MKKIKIWLEAVRAPFFTATLVPIILGTVVASYQFHSFFILHFLLVLAGGFFIHAGLDLSNDYFDHVSGVDEINLIKTPFSGGSRMIQNKILTPWQILRASIFCYAAGSTIGLYLNYILPGNTLLYIGMAGVFIAIFYTAKPFRIGYTGFGELSCFIGFGPIMVLGSYFVQAKQLTWLPVLLSVPVGILIALVLYINEFPDYEADKKGGKKTLVVILGKRKAIKLYYLFLAVCYLWIVLGVIKHMFPYSILIVFITLPLSVKAIQTARMHYDKVTELLPANALTIGIHLTFGLLLSAGYVLDRFIR